MITAMLGNDTVDMEAVGRDKLADIVGGEVEEALDTITLLGLQGEAALAFEQGIGGPGSAPENTSGIGGGSHGVEVLVELGGGNLLGFVNGEEQVGGGTDDLGPGLAREELQAGVAELIKVALGGFPEDRASRGRHQGIG